MSVSSWLESNCRFARSIGDIIRERGSLYVVRQTGKSVMVNGLPADEEISAMTGAGIGDLVFEVVEGTDGKKFAQAMADDFQAYFEQNRDSLLNDPRILEDLKNNGLVSYSLVGKIVGNEGLGNFCTRQINKILENHPFKEEFKKNEQERIAKENIDDYLYHATTKKNLRRIKSEGLRPGNESNFGGWYSGHSKGKVFLCEKGGVPYWKSKIEYTEDINKDRPSQIVVLRVLKNKVVGLQDDAPGTSDSRHKSYSTSAPIPMSNLEIVA